MVYQDWMDSIGLLGHMISGLQRTGQLVNQVES